MPTFASFATASAKGIPVPLSLTVSTLAVGSTETVMIPVLGRSILNRSADMIASEAFWIYSLSASRGFVYIPVVRVSRTNAPTFGV